MAGAKYLTTVNTANPTASSGAVTFTAVGASSRLRIGPALCYPESSAYQPVSDAIRTQVIQITGISGQTVSATIPATNGYAIAFGMIIESKDPTEITVDDYGAVGNGSNDDTAALQAAALATTYLKFRPGGLYKTTAAIALQINTTVEMHGAIIFPQAIGQAVFSRVNGAKPNYLADNITILGGYTECGTVTGVVGFQGTLANGITIRDHKWSNCTGYNYDFDRCDNVTVDNCVATNSNLYGGAQLVGKGRFRGEAATDAFQYRLIDYKVWNVGAGVQSPLVTVTDVTQFAGTLINVNSAPGATVYAISGDCEGFQINGGVVGSCLHGLTTTRILARVPLAGSITDFHIDQASGDAITITNGDFINIKGCILTGFGGHGINLLGDDTQPARGTVIQGNTFQGSVGSGFGISVGYQAPDTTIIGNYMREIASGFPIVVGRTASVVTISSAAQGVVTWASHGRSAGDAVVFTTTGTLPTNITPGVIYYVSATSLAAGTFKISATVGGAVIDTTAGVQAGTHTATAGVIPTDNLIVTNNNLDHLGWNAGAGDGGVTFVSALPKKWVAQNL